MQWMVSKHHSHVVTLNLQDQKITDHKITIPGNSRTWKWWTKSQGGKIDVQIICKIPCIFQPCDLIRHFPGPAFSVAALCGACIKWQVRTADRSGDDEVLYSTTVHPWPSRPGTMQPALTSSGRRRAPVDRRTVVVSIAVVETVVECWRTSGWPAVHIRVRVSRPRGGTIWPPTVLKS